jgi:hypothetical protein
MRRAALCAACFLIAGLAAAGRRSAVRLQAASAPPPPQLATALKGQLSATATRLVEGGAVWLTLWPVASLPPPPRDPPPPRVLARLPAGALIGALSVARPWLDYRDQQVPPGAYTLRYAVQPLLKEHAGVSPYRDFLLLVAAGDDDGQARSDEAWIDLSRKVTGTGHPAVLALLPIVAPSPRLIESGDGQLLLTVAGLPRGLALVVKGHGNLQPA